MSSSDSAPDGMRSDGSKRVHPPTIRPAASLHPICVHFTIALVAASLVFDVLGRARAAASLLAAGWWTLVLAIPLTLGTLLTGVLSRRRIPIGEGTALRYLRVHMALGPTFFGVLLPIGVWRTVLWEQSARPTIWYLVALGITVALMTVQGFLGGELVYAFSLDVRGGYERLPVHRP